MTSHPVKAMAASVMSVDAQGREAGRLIHLRLSTAQRRCQHPQLICLVEGNIDIEDPLYKACPRCSVIRGY